MKPSGISKLLIIIIIPFILGSCSSVKKPYYFSWTIHQEKHDENLASPSVQHVSSKSAILFEEGANYSKTQELQASTLVIPADSHPNELKIFHTMDYETVRINESRKIARNKNTLNDTLAQKKIKEHKKGDKQKNKFAKIGFAFAIAGFLAALGTPILLETVPLLIALPLLLVGLIFSIMGIKSEKRKLAIAGTIISGTFWAIALFGILAILVAFGG